MLTTKEPWAWTVSHGVCLLVGGDIELSLSDAHSLSVGPVISVFFPFFCMSELSPSHPSFSLRFTGHRSTLDEVRYVSGLTIWN